MTTAITFSCQNDAGSCASTTSNVVLRKSHTCCHARLKNLKLSNKSQEPAISSATMKVAPGYLHSKIEETWNQKKFLPV